LRRPFFNSTVVSVAVEIADSAATVLGSSVMREPARGAPPVRMG
jgi:hypothetical protein